MMAWLRSKEFTKTHNFRTGVSEVGKPTIVQLRNQWTTADGVLIHSPVVSESPVPFRVGALCSLRWALLCGALFLFPLSNLQNTPHTYLSGTNDRVYYGSIASQKVELRWWYFCGFWGVIGTLERATRVGDEGEQSAMWNRICFWSHYL